MASHAAFSQPMVGGPTASPGAAWSTDRLRKKRSRSEVSGFPSNGGFVQDTLLPPGITCFPKPKSVSPSARRPYRPYDTGSPKSWIIGAVMTMRLNQQPRLVEALNNTVDAMEWASA